MASSNRRYTCGVPTHHCGGSNAKVSAGLTNRVKKYHASSPQAFRCHARWLVNVEGYTQLGPREFFKGDGPVRVLTKKSKFGGVLRGGKRGEGGGQLNASVFIPAKMKGPRGGIVGNY